VIGGFSGELTVFWPADGIFDIPAGFHTHPSLFGRSGEVIEWEAFGEMDSEPIRHLFIPRNTRIDYTRDAVHESEVIMRLSEHFREAGLMLCEDDDGFTL
jgi:hypothetical protein